MSKREKMLLQIMICIGVVGVLAVYVLLPQIKKQRALKEEYEMVQFQSDNMTMILSQGGVVDSLETATETTENTWNFFQKGLSSYEIDTFINTLAEENNLKIMLLNIGTYEPCSDESLGLQPTLVEEGDETSIDGSVQVEDMLLQRAQVLVNVEGDYQDILAFMDAINRRSECVQITNCITSKDDTVVLRDEEGQAVEDYEYFRAQLTIDLYSIISYDAWRENAESRVAAEEEEGEVVW